jgi:arylsulfatase A-like enzyme
MWDFFPTVAEILNLDPPEDTDGISLLPVLLGETQKQKEHKFLYWEFKAEQAVRMDNWYGYKNKKGILEIYDLVENPEQDHDLSSDYPEVARRIDEIMQSEHTPSDVWPSPGESDEAFARRMSELGITPEQRPQNVADF